MNLNHLPEKEDHFKFAKKHLKLKNLKRFNLNSYLISFHIKEKKEQEGD